MTIWGRPGEGPPDELASVDMKMSALENKLFMASLTSSKMHEKVLFSGTKTKFLYYFLISFAC